MYFFLFEVFYCASIIPIKLSIALMLSRSLAIYVLLSRVAAESGCLEPMPQSDLRTVRIAQNRKGYVWSQWAMMSLFFIADGGALFYIIFQCKPVS